MDKYARIKAHLADHGLEVLEFSNPTPTVETAAVQVGCQPAEIAKSILLLVGGAPVLVVACGDVKVRNALLKQATGLSGKVVFPDAESVERWTGCPPGGVCPFLLPKALPVLLDESMRRFEVIYPAAGNAFSAVRVPVGWLPELTGGSWARACEIVLGG